MADLDDHLAGLQAFACRLGFRIDGEDHDPLGPRAQVELAAKRIGHRRHREAQVRELLLDPQRLFGRQGGQQALLLGDLKLAKLDLNRDHLAATEDIDIDRRAHLGIGDDTRQTPHILDIALVELDDHVAGHDASGLGRPTGRHAGHQGAARVVQPQALGDVVRHRLDAHTQPAAPGATELDDLADHALGQIGRNGEADTDRRTRRRVDRGVDADDLTVQVKQRTAGVAAIDRRIRLDEIVVPAGIDVPAPGRDDAGRNRSTQSERVADGHHPIADPERITVAPRHGRKRLVRLDTQNREVGLGIRADQFRLVGVLVLQDDRDLVGTGNHVVVGDDDARLVDDEARAKRTGLARRQVAILAPTVLEVLEEVLKGRSRWKLRDGRALQIRSFDQLRGRDVDDRRQQSFRQIGEAVGPLLGLGCLRGQKDDGHGERRHHPDQWFHAHRRNSGGIRMGTRA